MTDEKWNPWKLTALGLALVASTALVTGLVVASWGPSDEPGAPSTPRTGTARHVAAVPTAADVEACNQYARSRGDRTVEVVKDAAIGAVVGAGVGAAGGAVAQGGKGAGKGAAIGGIVGGTAGTLYGLNATKQNDARYAEAYRACLRGRGYTG
ncbi:MAG: hypothetical protein HYY95_07870 [Candidatus Rokubacteria bacterium]|nr:hypothetical protein [Candidatus Rokubacteria bacterium]MBI3105474.1 hypothetical protein [Candidatus Rokubacteria bacterium]